VPRIVLGLEYDGSGFAGWQWQRSRRTVQAVLEEAVGQVADQPVDLVCSGRTDAGVHALEQVAHFDCAAQRSPRSWVLGVNSRLPEDVRVLWAREAVEDFHARYSAVARYYRYAILNRPMKSALFRRRLTWNHRPLDEARMHAAAQHLIGEHDFSSFRAQGCQSSSPWRIMHFIHVSREDERVIIELSANAFLHHMVRNIAGVLMAVGAGEQDADWPKRLLEIRDRNQGGVTAPPDGLYLGGVFYPERYAMPRHPIFRHLPADARRFQPEAVEPAADSR
jgi:tRNA pseudouridine38-40 synthase